MLEPQAYRNSVSGAVHMSSAFDTDRFACGVVRTEKYYPCDALPTCRACECACLPMPGSGFIPITELSKYVPDFSTRTIRISAHP